MPNYGANYGDIFYVDLYVEMIPAALGHLKYSNQTKNTVEKKILHSPSVMATHGTPQKRNHSTSIKEYMFKWAGVQSYVPTEREYVYVLELAKENDALLPTSVEDMKNTLFGC